MNAKTTAIIITATSMTMLSNPGLSTSLTITCCWWATTLIPTLYSRTLWGMIGETKVMEPSRSTMIAGLGLSAMSSMDSE